MLLKRSSVKLIQRVGREGKKKKHISVRIVNSKFLTFRLPSQDSGHDFRGLIKRLVLFPPLERAGGYDEDCKGTALYTFP